MLISSDFPGASHVLGVTQGLQVQRSPGLLPTPIKLKASANRHL